MSGITKLETDLAWNSVHLYLKEFAELRGVDEITPEEFDEITAILEVELERVHILTGEEWWEDEE